MKKKFLNCFILLLSFSFFVSSCTIYKEEIKVTGMTFQNNYSEGENYSDDEIDLMNKCSQYIEQYSNEDSLTVDVEHLETIEDDIENISDKSVFFSAFSKTSFEDLLKKSNLLYENGGVYDESYVKYMLYSELLTIRLRALLYLEEYEEFKKVYIETYNIRWLTTNVQNFLCNDIELQGSSSATNSLIDVYEDIFLMVEDVEEKKIVVSDLMGLAGCEGVDEERLRNVVIEMRKIADPLDVESQELDMIFIGFNSEKLNPDKEFLCQIVIND